MFFYSTKIFIIFFREFQFMAFAPDDSCGSVSCLSPQLVGIVRFGYASRFCSISHRGETSLTCALQAWAQDTCVPLLHACHLMWEGFLSQPLISRYCPVWLCLTVLLNPTLGRDASHMCLISLSLRHMWHWVKPWGMSKTENTY